MTVKNIYEKSLPCMGDKIIHYDICENMVDNVIHYGIQISDKVGDENRKETIQDISPDKNLVCNLIDYLFQNVIDVTHFKDVVEDYILMSENV